MEPYTRVLIERMGMLLIVMFIMTRLPLFRMLLDRAVTIRTGLLFTLMFGLIGIAGTYSGVVAGTDGMQAAFWISRLEPGQLLAHSALIGVVLAGLLGGAYVGAGAGLIAGLHAAALGGLAGGAYLVSTPLIGLLAGLVARFFYEERIIAPIKAFFIGVFAPILQMGVILIYTTSSPEAIALVNSIGMPMVLSSSLGIALFVAMIQVALKEQERSGALETQRALAVAGTVLPHLEQELTVERASAAARVLALALPADAVAVADTASILAYTGSGSRRFEPLNPTGSPLCVQAIRTGGTVVAELRREEDESTLQAMASKRGRAVVPGSRRKDGLKLRAAREPGAVILIPYQQSGRTVGMLQLYYRNRRLIRRVEEEFAAGLSRLISSQLTLARAAELEVLTKEAELRALQAQIHPHFLFNTLNSIVTLIRTQPEAAKGLTYQLAQFMRASLRTAQSPLIPLEQELEQLGIYLNILRVRFGDQMRLECDACPDEAGIQIPPSTLQPLVENSIQHGLRSVRSGGIVKVTLRREPGCLSIAVEDNGSGIDGTALSKLGAAPLQTADPRGNGLGVYNVNQRLIRLFGAESALVYENLPAGGCRVAFRLPLERRIG
ncbi:LytS/YhcK type 5TM receptor domain-containing protein [Paenibacillus sp. D51F]